MPKKLLKGFSNLYYNELTANSATAYTPGSSYVRVYGAQSCTAAETRNDLMVQADDGVYHEESEFQSGELQIVVAGMTLADLAALSGADITKDIAAACPPAAAGATTTVLALTGLVVAQKGALASKALNASMIKAAGGAGVLGGALKVSFPWLLALTALLGLATAAYTAHQQAQEKAAQAAKDAAAAREKELQAAKDKAAALTDLRDEYDKLAQKEKKTYTDKVRMRQIENELATAYGLTVEKLNAAKAGHEGVTGAIQDEIDKTNELIELNNRDTAKNSLNAFAKTAQDMREAAAAKEKANQEWLTYHRKPDRYGHGHGGLRDPLSVVQQYG